MLSRSHRFADPEQGTDEQEESLHLIFEFNLQYRPHLMPKYLSFLKGSKTIARSDVQCGEYGSNEPVVNAMQSSPPWHLRLA